MTFKEKLLASALLLFVGFGLIAFLDRPNLSTAAQLNVPSYNYSYFNTNGTSTVCSVVSYSSGFVHALAVGTPGTQGVVTLYDTNSGLVSAMTASNATIFVSGNATTTATSTLTFPLNNQTVITANVANGSSTTEAAVAITTAVNASTTQLGVTATSSGALVTVTASQIGSVGNINLPQIAPQDGFTFSDAITNSAGTQIISQTTFGTSSAYVAPETALYDSFFRSGLCVQETVATSGVTVSWQQQ